MSKVIAIMSMSLDGYVSDREHHGACSQEALGRRLTSRCTDPAPLRRSPRYHSSLGGAGSLNLVIRLPT